MDAAVLLILTFACLFCWLVAITDKTTPLLFRAIGILFGVPTLVWYGFYVMGSTKSPVWNDIGGGPMALTALSLGVIAFMSREKPAKGNNSPSGGVPA